MKKLSTFLITLSLATPLLAAPALDRAPQLPPIDAGTVWAQINQQQNGYTPIPTIQPALTFAIEAADSLRKDLKDNGIKAKVSIINAKTGAYELAVEFKSWADYGKIKDLFYQDPGDNPSYMDLKIRPSAPKSAGDRMDLPWKSLKLQAADGTRVTIDYAPMDLGGTMMANPLWITVGKAGFSGNEKVRVAIMTYYEATANSADALKETKELDLPYNGTAFQAQGPEVSIYEGHHAWTHTFRQEIAVSVNGRWLADPVNGSHNFKFKLGR